MKTIDENEAYLGDGLYADFDGWQICLWTMRDNGKHEVYLEPAVFRALIKFANYINGKYRTKNFEGEGYKGLYGG